MKNAEEFIKDKNKGKQYEMLLVSIMPNQMLFPDFLELMNQYGKECFNEAVEESKTIVWRDIFNQNYSLQDIVGKFIKLKK